MQNIDEAVRVGIIEIMISPEYGRDWILELAEREFGNDPSEIILDEIDDRLSERLRDIAIDIVAELEDDKNIESYKNIR